MSTLNCMAYVRETDDYMSTLDCVVCERVGIHMSVLDCVIYERD